MGDIGAAGRAWIFVCITCRAATDPADAPDADAPRAGLALAEATAAAAANAPDISVKRIRCLGNCSRGLSAAIRCDERGRPESLKRGLIARIPPGNFEELP